MEKCNRLRRKHQIRRELLREVQRTPGTLAVALRDAILGPLAGTDDSISTLRAALEAPENRKHVASVLRLAERVLHARVSLPAGTRRRVADALREFVQDRLDLAAQALDPDVHSTLLRCFTQNVDRKSVAICDLVDKLQNDRVQHSLFVTHLSIRGAELCQMLDDRIAEELTLSSRRSVSRYSSDDWEISDAAQNGLVALFKTNRGLVKSKSGAIVSALAYSITSARMSLFHNRRREAHRRANMEDRAQSLSRSPESAPDEIMAAKENMRERVKQIGRSNPRKAQQLGDDLAKFEAHILEPLSDKGGQVRQTG